MEGAEIVARKISRYAIFENLYLDRVHPATTPTKSLEGALVRLYAFILQYLAKSKTYFELETASTSYIQSGVSAGLKCPYRSHLENIGKPSRGI